MPRRVPEHEVAWDIRMLACDLGRTPRVEDYREHDGGVHAYNTVVRRFGNWTAACEAAGLEANARGGPFEVPDDDELRGMSCREAASEFDVSTGTAQKWLSLLD